MNPVQFILLCLAGWIHREQQSVIEYLQEEIRVLKEIHGKRLRFNDQQRRRLAAKAKKIRFGKLGEIANIASPHTLRAWFRKLVAQKYDSSAKRSPGRPRTQDQIVSLVVQFAQENETWGYTKIRDALDNVGHEICRETVANILRDHGIVRAPERGTKTTWADFLKRHWDVLAATDFFTVEVFTLKGSVTGRSAVVRSAVFGPRWHRSFQDRCRLNVAKAPCGAVRAHSPSRLLRAAPSVFWGREIFSTCFWASGRNPSP